MGFHVTQQLQAGTATIPERENATAGANPCRSFYPNTMKVNFLEPRLHTIIIKATIDVFV